MIKMIKENIFNYNDSKDQKNNLEKPLKNNKVKFFKQLNLKSNIFARSVKKVSKMFNSSNQNSLLFGDSRNRKQSEISMKELHECIIPNAKIIKSSWKNSKLNGYVQIQYFNGNYFQGIFRQGIKFSGKMIYSQAKCEYQGGFFGEKFSGYGKLSYINGRIIEGEWENYELIGNAIISYPNGHAYSGSVNENLYKDGDGYLFLNHGYKYVGQFSNGSITGVGSYYKNNDLLIKGVWLKGKLIKQMAQSDETVDLKDNQFLNLNKDQKCLQKNLQFQKYHKKISLLICQTLASPTSSVMCLRTIENQQKDSEEKDQKIKKSRF